MSRPRDHVDATLAALEGDDRLRALVPIAPRDAVHAEVAGRPLVLFSSNDYLGLSTHPEVRDAAARAAAEQGMGPRSAALICGYTEEHEALEAELAALKGTEAALLLPTGYQANLATVAALGGRGCTLFSDALNHASLIDGCRLARADAVEVYRHRDPEDLARRLAVCRTPRRVIVTDSVFSMEGTRAPLAALRDLADRHDADLVVDEAHATLVHGPAGAGLATEAGLTGEGRWQVLTLSKAVGAMGGCVATTARQRRYLLNTGRAFVFTTAPPAPVVAAARAALRVATRDDTLRRTLWARIARLAAALGRPLDGPIVPVVLGDNAATVAASRALLAEGLHVPAIRPPTVPRGTARLRVALSAAHTEADIDRLAQALRPYAR